ncbi:MAG: hypothetical protein J6D34_06965 [Atopobiaceae bacterium]|nr:hypothetical protein [Atopobiaceae bacterium]
MKYNELTEEQKAKAAECKTPEELIALAKDEGIELSAEQLDAISGGDDWVPVPDYKQCPHWELGV